MLPAVWTLRDVEDVEELCVGVLAEATRRLCRPLERCDLEESLAFLLGEVVVLDRVYDPARVGIVFRPWLYQRLRFRLVDHWRTTFGRHGEKRVPDNGLSLRELDAEAADNLRGGGLGQARPGSAPAGGAADVGGAWSLPREWLDLHRDRAADRPIGRLGFAEGRGGAPGDRRADQDRQLREVAA